MKTSPAERAYFAVKAFYQMPFGGLCYGGMKFVRLDNCFIRGKEQGHKK
jgi:hypothetical protein